MSKISVIYKSKYGATKKYAQWIADALGATLLEASAVKPAQLAEYDLVIYGGGLYASGINGVKLVTKNPCKKVIVFTVGLADPSTTDYSEILASNFTTEQLAEIKVFHLRGGIDYSKLGLVHKGLMAMVKASAAKKDKSQLTSEDKGILETYGKAIDFTDKNSIAPIVEWAKEIQRR